ncbi:MAG: helix-turn-helix domain-containing protein [Actinomycetota bacterium]|nr:helix-turn-helix domain-containing protein [Actinomycetota bacterium]
MEEKPTGGEHAAEPRQEAEEGAPEAGWISTEDAAAVLGVSPRTVREYIRSGSLGAKSEGVGVLKRWLVSEGGVQAMLEQRRSSGELPRSRHEPAGGLVPSAGGSAEDAEPMATSQDLQYRLGYADARLDLTERALITLQAERDRLLDDLERERQRADRERERTEEVRSDADQLERQEFATRQKAERLEWERDQAREEAQRRREELETEQGKVLRRTVLAGILLVFVVAAVAATAAALWVSQA